MKKYVIYQNTTKGINYVSDKYGSTDTTDINKAFKYDSIEEADAQKKICNKVFMEHGMPLCMIKEVEVV